MVNGLTETQKRVMQEIEAYSAQAGHPPTLKELAAMIGVTTATIHQHCRSLRLKGCVHWEPNTQRTIRVTDEARRLTG